MKPLDQRLGGFTLPLVTVLVFSLLSLVGALVAMSSMVAKAAASARSDVSAHVTLESVANLALEHLTPPLATPVPRAIQLNGQVVDVEVERPEAKADINADELSEILSAARRAGVAETVVARVQHAHKGPSPDRRSARFVEFAAAAALTALEEDCLRRRLTTGRWPGEQVASASQAEPLGVGDQVDVRVSAKSRSVRQVLWVRARYTGLPDRPWRFHEWRRLQIPASATCNGALR